MLAIFTKNLKKKTIFHALANGIHINALAGKTMTASVLCFRFHILFLTTTDKHSACEIAQKANKEYLISQWWRVFCCRVQAICNYKFAKNCRKNILDKHIISLEK